MTDEKLSELEAELARVKAELTRVKAEVREQKEREIVVYFTGPWAEQIFGESFPDDDAIRETGYHEAGHYIAMQALGFPSVAITVQLFPDGRLLGTAHLTRETISYSGPITTDAENAGSRLQVCADVGVSLDLDECIKKAEGLVRAGWARIQRIGEHVASVCRSQSGKDWRVVISAEMIERLFWNRARWSEHYGIPENF